MPAGNKKKKKPAANPARGFATTSVASKPKSEDASEANSAIPSGVATPASKKDVTTATVQHVDSGSAQPSVDRELHELSPEELEAQLEASELQQFVEKHAAKIKKEALRQVTRLQTDKRVLRGQADYLSVKDWLPEEIMQQILDLTVADLKHDTSTQKRTSLPPEDDLVAKVWQLRTCLFDLDLPSARVNEVLGWVVANPPVESSTGTVWGLEECLEWLSLHCQPGELEEYDYQKPKAVAAAVDESEDEPDQLKTNGDHATKGQQTSVSTMERDTTAVADEEDIHVSDMESDMEPDELLSVYLRTKGKLYMLNPQSDAQKGRGKGRSVNGPSQFNRTAAERKLEQKLQKIESDVLFDKREADAHWAGQKIELARESAERRKLQLRNEGTATPQRSSTPTSKSADVSEEAEKLGEELLRESEEDGDILSGMFDALPGVEQANGAPSSNDNAAHVTIRDFGKLTGMSPKRVLEEACKARDSRCKIAFKMVSPTTYACRHAVTLQWSKEQEPVDATYLSAVSLLAKANSIVMTMTEIATPNVAQSEAYAATAALFVVFSGSPKEEKAHMRLPPAFRNLWDEFAKAKQEYVFAEDGSVVKEVRELVEKNRNTDDDSDEEVVFNASSRRRLDGASGANTPISRSDGRRSATPEFSEELQQMWQRKSGMPKYQQMLVSRTNLPMFRFREAALDIIHKHQVTILCGETGCGKSTQLPAFILENELSNGRPCKIYCTEPRRISAISLAQRVSEEMGDHKGDVGTSRSLVGYAIRLESQTTAQTRLVYATVGIVLRMLESGDGISEVTHLVVDEVHERSIDTDFLLIILKSLMNKRPDLKVVLMSATVDAQKFSNYLGNAPIIQVPGRTFPVQAQFLEDAIELTGHTNEDASANAVDEDDADDADQEKSEGQQQLDSYSKKTRQTLANYDEYRIDYSLIVKLIEKIAHVEQYNRFSKAILVFLPGIAEIRQLNDMLGGHPKFMKSWQVFPLHSSFSSEDQQAAFEVPPPGMRKIVLATNIAETGITIPDVTCVIDTGKHKEMRFDERRQMSRLIQSFIARANAKQRRGRAGRVQEGLCFHLFTKHRFEQGMIEQQTPEMLRLSLQDLVMRVKICKLGSIESALAQALDPPAGKNVRRAIDALIEVGALTPTEELTWLGTQLAKLPLDTQLGKLILLGSTFGCLDFALTAAATLSSKSPFLSPLHAKKQADTVRLGFKRGDSDLLTAYNAYTTWRKVCTTAGLPEYQFCNKNFLSPQNLANIEDLKAQLLSSLVEAHFVHLGPEDKQALSRLRHHHNNSRKRTFISLPSQYTHSDTNDTLASAVIAWSFYPKIVKRDDGKGWRNISHHQSLGLHPTSVNKHSLLPPNIHYLSFYSIMQSSSSRFTNAQETSAVAELPLLLLSGEARFELYAGVIIIDGNRLRFKVRDWRTMIVLKVLRGKVKEVLGKVMKAPGRELGDRPRRWMEVLERVFERWRPREQQQQGLQGVK
ncbi:Putative helicase, P-loop containing nucleoside triphosphate hydrolase [Septoria linicola]|uniref:RNA helicase n=1 Tax=Septoria linicola TaxID=215465 RepID=A0A9Q9EPL2_9PEZI|nr:putative helicase, P-loop containing nucleoside triphosphate hydrolase [Septoria linicola]USW56643.1 Putative helicase, P-loop containing nucleoside triphosphate hydrolase [Septoria linicola]